MLTAATRNPGFNDIGLLTVPLVLLKNYLDTKTKIQQNLTSLPPVAHCCSVQPGSSDTGLVDRPQHDMVEVLARCSADSTTAHNCASWTEPPNRRHVNVLCAYCHYPGAVPLNIVLYPPA